MSAEFRRKRSSGAPAKVGRVGMKNAVHTQELSAGVQFLSAEFPRKRSSGAPAKVGRVGMKNAVHTQELSAGVQVLERRVAT